MSVALIGSSGGGAATLGHTDPEELLGLIHSELRRVVDRRGGRHRLAYGLFLALRDGEGLDAADPATARAALYVVEDGAVRVEVEDGTLAEVNVRYRELDATELAPRLRRGDFRDGGLICASCDPTDVNAASLRAAAAAGVPTTGSGGTSLAAASATHGIVFVGNAGGSVATTASARAACYAHALASVDDKEATYEPFGGGGGGDGRTKPRLRSVLEACLPAFLAVSVGVRLAGDDALADALPVVCAVAAASACSDVGAADPSLLIAAAIASTGCRGSVLAALWAGKAVAYATRRALVVCVRAGSPATATNVVVGGGVGTVAAAAARASGVAETLAAITESSRAATDDVAAAAPPGVGAALGCLFCYGSKVGWYHSVYLPLILLEMEKGGSSLFGAVDQCTLVMVSAGICTANLLLSKENSALSRRAVVVNIFCGDFIEAAYPSMERSRLVNYGGGYLASALSTEILLRRGVKSSAYLPLPLAIWLAGYEWYAMATACAVAFGVSFAATVAAHACGFLRTTTTEREDAGSSSATVDKKKT